MERKNVMIWGGSRGLGKEIARESVRLGHTTWITARDPRKAMEDPELDGIAKCDLADFNSVGAPGIFKNEKVGRDFYAHALNADILFWVAGHWLRKPFHECSLTEIEEQINVHLTVPLLRLRHILNIRITSQMRDRRPLHLIVISSSSSWKIRSDGQAVYGMVQAGKAHFARNLAPELDRELPPSKVLLVTPGGMRTDFFRGSDVDSSLFMNPVLVAEEIWENIRLQRTYFHEIDIRRPRGSSDTIEVKSGSTAPQ